MTGKPFAKPQAIRTQSARHLTGTWLYHSQTLNRYVSIPDADLVCDGCKCPGCGEMRVDFLVWRDSPEGEYVECASCGAWYDPNEKEV